MREEEQGRAPAPCEVQDDATETAEATLVLESQRGSADAAEILYKRYEKVIESKARQIALRTNRRDLFEDLEGEGWVGFVKALREYQPDRGVPFAAFARQRIRWSMLAALTRALGITEQARRQLGRVLQSYRELRGQLGRNPTPDELAKNACVDQDVVEEILRAFGVLNVDLDEIGTEADDLEEAPAVLRLQAVRLAMPVMVQYIVLQILRTEFEYSWEEVVQALGNNRPPIPDWDNVVSREYPGLRKAYPEIANWQAIHELFRTPPPSLNTAALRQFFSRMARQIACL